MSVIVEYEQRRQPNRAMRRRNQKLSPGKSSILLCRRCGKPSIAPIAQSCQCKVRVRSSMRQRGQQDE